MLSSRQSPCQLFVSSIPLPKPRPTAIDLENECPPGESNASKPPFTGMTLADEADAEIEVLKSDLELDTFPAEVLK
jgi:hypothetical protein